MTIFSIIKIWVRPSFILFILMIELNVWYASSQEATPEPIPLIASVDEWQEILMPTQVCSLPCWWNVYPGETTLQEAKEDLEQRLEGYVWLDWTTDKGNYEGIIAYPENPIDRESLPRVEVYKPFGLTLQADKDGVVDIISIGFSEAVPLEQRIVWKYFEPVNLITEYGTPDYIRTDLRQTETGLAGVSLILHWEDIDFAVAYDITLSFMEGTSKSGQPLCFNMDTVTGFSINLQHPENERLIEELSGEGWIIGTQALDEISDLTEEEFADILIENEGCLPVDLPIEN